MSQKIILKADDSISCPHCEKTFPLAEGLSHHLIEQYEDEYEAMLNKERAELEQRVSKEQERKSAKQYQTQLDNLKEQLQESTDLQKKSKAQLEVAKKKAAEQAREDADLQLAELKDDLLNKDKKLGEFRATEVQLRKEKKQIEEQKADLVLEVERKLEAERQAIEAKLNGSFLLKEAELKKKIVDTQKANEEKDRKSTKEYKSQLESAKKKAAEQAREDADLQLAELKDDLLNKDKKLVEFRAGEVQLRKEKKQIEEQKADLVLEVERKLEAERRIIELKINESFLLKEAELKKKITDAQKANEELTRKLEQGSQQLQGEVLELEVESLLQQSYPFDEIEPVKKGVRGADVIQIVKLRSGGVCGKIVWETKRAENWSNNWIPKLKEDLQRVNGDIAVLVSTKFPANVNDGIVQHEGVWLVRPELVSGLSAALRTVLIESQRQKAVSAGKGEQMEALFDYITSNQFAQRVRAVVENYETMRIDLEKEKSAMQRLWKKRETQIGRISDQMLAVCGELQGISAASLPMLDSIAGLDFALEDE